VRVGRFGKVRQQPGTWVLGRKFNIRAEEVLGHSDPLEIVTSRLRGDLGRMRTIKLQSNRKNKNASKYQ